MSAASKTFRARQRGAVDVLIALVIAAAIAGGALGLWIGHDWGKGARADELGALQQQVGTLTGQLGTVTGERNTARETANTNASNLTSLRGVLARERHDRQLREQNAQRELGERADRIAELERNAGNRFDTITEKAANDEDCAALRDLPVCAAVAERLWGDAATADPH